MQKTARISVKNSAFEYINRNLIILDRTVDVYSKRIRQKFLVQRKYVTAYIKEIKSKIDERLVAINKKFEKTNRNI